VIPIRRTLFNEDACEVRAGPPDVWRASMNGAVVCAYCSLPAKLVYSSSFQPDGRSTAAKTIFSRSPATKGYSPTARTAVLTPIRQHSQNNPQA